MPDYIRDGAEIYRQSFATIRAEADLAAIPADLEKLAVRLIHACGMVEYIGAGLGDFVTLSFPVKKPNG